jgi:hypothetical protein
MSYPLIVVSMGDWPNKSHDNVFNGVYSSMIFYTFYQVGLFLTVAMPAVNDNCLGLSFAASDVPRTS